MSIDIDFMNSFINNTVFDLQVASLMVCIWRELPGTERTAA